MGDGRIILIEGLDATGKSTLVGRLYNKLRPPVAVLHAGPPLLTTAIREYVWPLGIASVGYTVICDRWHLGELVWPRIFDRDSLIEDSVALHHVEENIRYLNTPILPLYMCRAFNQIEMELVARSNERFDDQHERVLQQLEKASAFYDEALKASSLDWLNATLHSAEGTVYSWMDSFNQ